MNAAALFAACAGLALAARGYATGSVPLFYAALGAVAATCALPVWAGRRDRRAWAPRLALGALSVVAGFLLVELVWAVAEALLPQRPVGRSFTWSEAEADGAAFRQWWRQHLARWARLDPHLVGPDPSGRNPYVLIPGARLQRGESLLRVNGLGFRGDEIVQPKGERLRVVALGESTTFGLTVLAGDRPWPELLGASIAQEGLCARPVEVINAGVPGWTLANQVARLPHDVLPLEPDLLVTYHGWNGFAPLLRGVPGLRFAALGDLRARPSRILERVERALRLRALRRAQPDAALEPAVDDAALLATGYGRSYLALAAAARARGIALALGSFNLAVDAASPGKVIGFYESLMSDTRSGIVANRLHTRLLRIVTASSEARFVDTSPGLDGSFGPAYVDLMHFSQSGREALAANFLAGLRRTLRQHPRCRDATRAAEPIAQRVPAPTGRRTSTTQAGGGRVPAGSGCRSKNPASGSKRCATSEARAGA